MRTTECLLRRPLLLAKGSRRSRCWTAALPTERWTTSVDVSAESRKEPWELRRRKTRKGRKRGESRKEGKVRSSLKVGVRSLAAVEREER